MIDDGHIPAELRCECHERHCVWSTPANDETHCRVNNLKRDLYFTELLDKSTPARTQRVVNPRFYKLENRLIAPVTSRYGELTRNQSMRTDVGVVVSFSGRDDCRK